MSNIPGKNAKIIFFDPTELTTPLLDATCKTEEFKIKEKSEKIKASTLCETDVAQGESDHEFSGKIFFSATTNLTTYEDSPQGVLRNLRKTGEKVVIRYQEQGTGSGKPQRQFTGIIFEIEEIVSRGKFLGADFSGSIAGEITDSIQT